MQVEAILLMEVQSFLDLLKNTSNKCTTPLEWKVRKELTGVLHQE